MQLLLFRQGFNTQPPEGGWPSERTTLLIACSMFQHTAARRRLDTFQSISIADYLFQHTAARRRLGQGMFVIASFDRFNTQPPEGGWHRPPLWAFPHARFQHTAARRRLGRFTAIISRLSGFNTQPPEGGWQGCSQMGIAQLSFNTQPPEGGWSSNHDNL